MKISWGTSIVLSLIGFILFIMFFVVSMLFDENYNHDLVTENYYHSEIQFQEQLDKEQNALKFHEGLSFKRTKEGLEVHLPADLKNRQITGWIQLYRPSDKKLDQKWPVVFDKGSMLIDDSRMVRGRWNILLEWTHQGKEFLIKKEITY